MLPYTAYLRVYEPLSAFPEAERQRWAAYAASADRPRRARALAAEQADALRRMLALPPIAAPEEESGDAYVRWVDGTTYICPWQTRLRCWLALARLRETSPALLAAAFHAADTEAAIRRFSRPSPLDWPLRVHIQASTWSLPPEWFVPFASDERWLVLGSGDPADGDAGDGGADEGAEDTRVAESEPGERATAAATRTLVYSTTMAQARHRVARALAAIGRASQSRAGDAGGVERGGHGDQGLLDGRDPSGGRGLTADRGPGGEQPPADRQGPAQMLGGLEQVGCWLEEFHSQALVELDYGGLVHLLSDGALRADQSVAEVGAAVRALGMDEHGLASAMHMRVTRRWEPLESLRRAT